MRHSSFQQLELVVEFDGMDIDGDKLTLEWHVIDHQCVVNPAHCTDVNLFFDRCVLYSVNLKRRSKDDVSALLINSASNSPVTSPTYTFNATAYNRTVFMQFDVEGSDLASLQRKASERCPKFKTLISMRVGRDRDRYPFDWCVFWICYLLLLYLTLPSRFFGYATVFGRDASTNQSVSLVIDRGVGLAACVSLVCFGEYVLNADNPVGINLTLSCLQPTLHWTGTSQFYSQ